MIFEYDENKSKINKSKHNISFDEAKELWEDPYSFEIPSPQSEDEERFLVFGQINTKNYTAIITYRDTNIRIISVRRSREKEIKFYESIRTR
jgi:uncharacterized DUF497 family protein